MENKYLFILGRNPELSVKEVFSYFNKEKIKILNYSLIKNGLFLEINEEINLDIINEFGGVISIGKVILGGNLEFLKKEISQKMIYSGTKNNITYVLFNFSDIDSFDKIREVIKKKFRNEKLKATEKPLTGIMEMQNGKRINIVGSKIDEQYFLFSLDSKLFYFGKIESSYNYNSLEKRDMEKPFRREELAISPRLAKIIINLSEVKTKGKIIDPFCGIGVILFEGLLKNLNVTGIDIDKNAIEGAEQNLEWGKFSNKNYKVLINDSSKVKFNENFDVLVSEPDLGETLKKFPTKEKADEILKKFENLIIRVLNNFKNNVKGRIVFSSPFIMTMEKKRKGCDIKNILNKTRLKLVKGFPIEDFRYNQVVGRQIFVLEK